MLGAAAWGMWVVLGSMAAQGVVPPDEPLLTEADGVAPLADPLTAALVASPDAPLLSAEDAHAPLETLLPQEAPEESLLVAAVVARPADDERTPLPVPGMRTPRVPRARVPDVRGALPAVLVGAAVVGVGALVLAASAVMAQSVGRAVALAGGRPPDGGVVPQAGLLLVAAGLGGVAAAAAGVFVGAVLVRAALEEVASHTPSLLVLPSEIRVQDVEGL